MGIQRRRLFNRRVLHGEEAAAAPFCSRLLSRPRRNGTARLDDRRDASRLSSLGVVVKFYEARFGVRIKAFASVVKGVRGKRNREIAAAVSRGVAPTRARAEKRRVPEKRYLRGAFEKYRPTNNGKERWLRSDNRIEAAYHGP